MQTPFLVFVILPLILGGAVLVGLYLMTRIMPGVAKTGKAAETAVETVPSRGPEYVQLRARRAAAYRLGLIVLVSLAVFSIIEYFMAFLGSTTLMFIMMVIKASLILYYFMHITTVWRGEEAH